jgi:hypothetical protein
VLDRRYEPIVFLRPILSECVYSFTCWIPKTGN